MKAKPRYTDIVYAMVTGGVVNLKRLEKPPSRYTMLRAVTVLQGRNREKEAQALFAYLRSVYPPKPPKEPPKAGERRPYKVVDQDGTLCVRPPVALLNVPKGGLVAAGFGVVDEEALKTGRFIFLSATGTVVDAK